MAARVFVLAAATLALAFTLFAGDAAAWEHEWLLGPDAHDVYVKEVEKHRLDKHYSLPIATKRERAINRYMGARDCVNDCSKSCQWRPSAYENQMLRLKRMVLAAQRSKCLLATTSPYRLSHTAVKTMMKKRSLRSAGTATWMTKRSQMNDDILSGISSVTSGETKRFRLDGQGLGRAAKVAYGLATTKAKLSVTRAYYRLRNAHFALNTLGARTTAKAMLSAVRVNVARDSPGRITNAAAGIVRELANVCARQARFAWNLGSFKSSQDIDFAVSAVVEAVDREIKKISNAVPNGIAAADFIAKALDSALSKNAVSSVGPAEARNLAKTVGDLTHRVVRTLIVGAVERYHRDARSVHCLGRCMSHCTR